MTRPHSDELLALVRHGDDAATREIFDRYVARLLALVRERIGSRLRRRIDADDVVQSAYRSFFVHAKEGEYQLGQSGDLWRLLASIAINKLYGQIEKQTAARRDLAREEVGSRPTEKYVADVEPNAAEVVAIAEQLHLIGNELSLPQRAALIGHLRGDSVETIAAAAGKSPRTTRRLLAEVRDVFERQLLADESSRHAIDDATRREFDARAPLLYRDYDLKRLVGAGGMGKVYRAVERHNGDVVAVKTIHKSRQVDRRVVERFLQEADVLSQLDHPNIVHFRGMGRFPGGGYFIVMDYVDGHDLQSRMLNDRLSAKISLRILMTVANAVAYAHSRGVVHGDLKPANILVDSNEKVVVSDFGFAQFMNSELPAKQTLIGGTAGYIAPEVRDGAFPKALSDIYALLSTIIEAGDFDDDMHGGLLEICHRCMSPQPSNRFQSAEEFALALQI